MSCRIRLLCRNSNTSLVILLASFLLAVEAVSLCPALGCCSCESVASSAMTANFARHQTQPPQLEAGTAIGVSVDFGDNRDLFSKTQAASCMPMPYHPVKHPMGNTGDCTQTSPSECAVVASLHCTAPCMCCTSCMCLFSGVLVPCPGRLNGTTYSQGSSSK
jgi:hypothetical protein